MSEEKVQTSATDEGEIPAWLVGEGLDANMAGEARFGAQKNLRLWLPKGSEKKVIFLTSGKDFKVIWEHNFKIGNGKTAFMNWATCLAPTGKPCPACKHADSHDGEFGRYKIMVGTVLDLSEYTDKQGKVWKDQKRLYCAKKEAAEILKKKYETRKSEGQDLKFALFKLFRTNGDKSCSVGDDYEFMKMIDPVTLKDAKELNYAELLKPDPERIKRMLDAATSGREKVPFDVAEGAEVGLGEGTEDKVTY